MKIPTWLPIWGDSDYRGPCPREAVEQVTFFRRLRDAHPDTWGRIAIHPRNEGKRRHDQASREKAEGMTTGASDVIIPARVPFVCEIKRRDHTKSQWQDGQIEYLEAAYCCGAFVCVALGADAASQAFAEWSSRYTLPDAETRTTPRQEESSGNGPSVGV